MDFRQRITIDPQICHGKPCIRGLRYSTHYFGDIAQQAPKWANGAFGEWR